MKNKFLVLILVLVTSAAVLSACGATQEEREPAEILPEPSSAY